MAKNPVAFGTAAPLNATNNFYRYEYQLKDHLGNLRVSCRCLEKAAPSGANGAGILAVVQENHYDPWGLNLPMNTSTATDNVAGNPTDRYQYNGKERNIDLNWYEYGFRWYDPATARFIQVDPLAMQYPHWTTYQYAGDMPINFVDLDGLEPAYYDKVVRSLRLRTVNRK